MAFMLGLYQTRAGVRVFKHRSGLINGEGSTCCVSWESWRHWQRRHHHASTMVYFVNLVSLELDSYADNKTQGATQSLQRLYEKLQFHTSEPTMPRLC
jgi:hypothetical protein